MLSESRTTLQRLSPLIMGGAGFSYQLNPEPESLPVLQIIQKAFDLGLRTIDTSPYYEPSEQLMGAALSEIEKTTKYRRCDYTLMTKVGRIKERQFDYSAEWIKKSVTRSLQRFQTSYLDVVFVHDVELVSMDEAVQAVGTLFELAKTGIIHHVGISGYKIETLAQIARLVKSRYGQPVEVIQTWAQLTLQNTRLEQSGLEMFYNAGVKAVCASSPLAVGLLRSGGVPIGRTGNWHPAPSGLREAAQQAAELLQSSGESLADLALQYAIMKAVKNSRPDFIVSTITGIGSISDLVENIRSADTILQNPGGLANGHSTSAIELLGNFPILDKETIARNEPLFNQIRMKIGPWIDYDFFERK